MTLINLLIEYCDIIAIVVIIIFMTIVLRRPEIEPETEIQENKPPTEAEELRSLEKILYMLKRRTGKR